MRQCENRVLDGPASGEKGSKGGPYSIVILALEHSLAVSAPKRPTCEDRVLDGPASGKRAPMVGHGATVFGVRISAAMS